MTRPSDRPESHYDHVTRAWRYLLGEDLHWGVFDAEDEPLAVATQRLTELMAKQAALSAGMRVLDVGCGIGNPALYLSREHGVSVTGITISQEGVDLARAKARREARAADVRFLKADAQDNGLPSEEFDRAWVLESSHLMPKKDWMIAECSRCLVPGGRIVLCDLMLKRKLPLQDVLRRARAFDLLRRVFGRARMDTMDQYATWCANAGLQVLHRTDLTATTRPTLDRWEDNARRFESEVIALIGEVAHREFGASCAALRTFWDEGIMGYGLIVAERAGSTRSSQT